MIGWAILAAAAFGCGSQKELAVPSDLPAITVTNLTGESLPLPSHLADKPLLIWFWAPW